MRNVSFEVKPGEVVGIISRNGAENRTARADRKSGGDHDEPSILAKVVIKSEGRIYLQSFHQSERSTIRKAKLFVVVAHKDFPRPVLILLRDLYQAGDLFLTQTFTETDGRAMTHVELNQGDGLIENIGTGNQRGCEVLDELAGCDVVSIAFVHEGIPGTGVRESQGEGTLSSLAVKIGVVSG